MADLGARREIRGMDGAERPQQLSFRTTADLFSALPVSDVREVLRRTRRDAEAKAAELRQLVGSRYPDLLQSADAIQDIRAKAEALHARLANLSAVRVRARVRARCCVPWQWRDCVHHGHRWHHCR